MIRLSFVIPVYNVEPYLRQCFESIVDQSYGDIEIILVDDESTDGSSELCDILASEDARVKVFHISHCGVSACRNVGVEHASGEYMMFIDSDDYLTCRDESLYGLAKVIEDNNRPDFVALNFVSAYPDGSVEPNKAFPKELLEINNRDDLIRYQVTSHDLLHVPWGKLLNVAFVRSVGLRFIDGLIHEDIIWFIDLLDKANSFKYVDEYIYAYRRQREDSITGDQNAMTHFDARIQIMDLLLERIERLRFDKSSHKFLLSYVGFSFNACLVQLSLMPYSQSRRRWKEIKRFGNILRFSSFSNHPAKKMVNKVFGHQMTLTMMQAYAFVKNAVLRD